MPKIDILLHAMRAEDASDLHLTSGYPPCLRVHGDIRVMTQHAAMPSEAIRELLFEIMPERNRADFERNWDTDFAHEYEQTARLRVNAFVDHSGVGAVLRLIPSQVPTIEDLGLPKVVQDLCRLSKGLILVTGPTGSGKSTTLAALIDYINRTRADHIITIEDPIEFVHRPHRCLIHQREVHRHTRSFATALRAALREDPNIVLVGEMRDLETMEIAIETAETGHLVLGTLHTNTAPAAVDRIIDKFPTDRQNQIRTMLADSLKGVIAQTLCRRKAGGRVAALEILIVAPGISSNIREGKSHQIPSMIQTGRSLGMQLLNDHLLRLVLDGVISAREAYLQAVDRDALENKLKESGLPLDIDTNRLSDVAGPSAVSVERLERLRYVVQQSRETLSQDPQNLNALNNLAWICATSLADDLRNGREAVKLAERAYLLSKGQDLHVLDTLGAAYAEAGQFQKAIEIAQQRLALASRTSDRDLIESIKGQIKLYESGRALRDV